MAGSRRAALISLLLLPAGLTAFLAFNSGGFYPGTSAYAAVILCIVLLLRVTLAENPFEGWGPWMSGVTCALVLYALLTLVSQTWSHAPGRALVEFDRALLYLLAVVVFGSVAYRPERLRWALRALALTMVAICVCGLLTRLLPHLWPTAPEIAGMRLSFPLTYWNALGLVGAYGIVLCAQSSSDPGEPPWVRVLAAAAIPVLATTVYFTLSRGGVAAAAIGVIVAVIVGRPRAILSTLLAVGPTTAVAISYAYAANLLVGPSPTTAGAVAQGRHVATAVVVCAAISACVRGLLVWRLDRPLARLTLPHPPKRMRVVGWGVLAVSALIAAIALQSAIGHEYQRFVRSQAAGNPGDVRTRLTDPSSDGRIDYWRVAWHEFERAPALGHGAGTFETTWTKYRSTPLNVLDAHSLYLETLDELGVLGLMLLAGVILAIMVQAAARARRSAGLPNATAFALLLVWALHAGIDWDWEMPAVTLPFFAIGGFVLARPTTVGAVPPARVASAIARRRVRALATVGCLFLAAVPAVTWLSQRRLDQATAMFANDDCQAATRSAASSISILADRPEPYEVLGYCDLRRGLPGRAIAAIQKAISLDPENWNYHYDLAVMQASAGLNPVPEARTAVSLNPLEPLAQGALQTFRRDDRAQREKDGKAIADAFTTL